jgi:uncharacterized RDD family membrane protein YckC
VQDLLDTDSQETALAASNPPALISGFWRRCAAFGIDAAFVLALGFLIGRMLFHTLAQLGGWGSVLGFGITLLYFALPNSRLGGGQTLGKRIMSIMVVGRDGQTVSPLRSMIRHGVLAAPFFLNDASLPASFGVAQLASVIVYGLGGAIMLLYLLNSTTRQSLHDLAAGTYVVAIQSHGVVEPPTQKWPVQVVAGWLLVVITASFVVPRFATDHGLAEVREVHDTIVALDNIRSVVVFTGVTFEASGERVNFVWIEALLREPPADSYPAAATSLAAVVLKEYPALMTRDSISIEVEYGYDIGIAATSVGVGVRYSPEEWQELLNGAGEIQ